MKRVCDSRTLNWSENFKESDHIQAYYVEAAHYSKQAPHDKAVDEDEEEEV